MRNLVEWLIEVLGFTHEEIRETPIDILTHWKDRYWIEHYRPSSVYKHMEYKMKFTEWLKDTMGYSDLEIESAPPEDLEDLRTQYLEEQKSDFEHRFRSLENPEAANLKQPIELEVGKWVKHVPSGEVGRIKTYGSSVAHVYVVYNCNDNWDRYKEYTGQRTPVLELEECEPLTQ